MSADLNQSIDPSKDRPAENPALQDAPPHGADAQRPTPELLLWAYGHSLFPMANTDEGRIDWFSPDPRGVFPLDPPEAFHVPRNVQRELRRGAFEIRSDCAFEEVMRACAQPRDEENGTWMNESLHKAYLGLFQMGHAHSVGAWRDGKLVGGLYGVHIGGAFFGESMFSRPGEGGSNSSKVCLAHLVHWLQKRGFTLLDTQFWNEHLDQFGCVEISAEQYLALLADAIRLPVTWGEFAPLTPQEWS